MQTYLVPVWLLFLFPYPGMLVHVVPELGWGPILICLWWCHEDLPK